jgi:hypothetical protein
MVTTARTARPLPGGFNLIALQFVNWMYIDRSADGGTLRLPAGNGRGPWRIDRIIVA